MYPHAKGRWAGLGPVLFGIGILALPGCFLDRSGIASPCQHFDGSARVSTTAGVQTLTTDDGSFTRGQFLQGCGLDEAQREMDALERWDAYVPQRLEEICATEPDSELGRRLCPGPWCYVERASVTARSPMPSPDPAPAPTPIPRPTASPSPIPDCMEPMPGDPIVGVDPPSGLAFGSTPVRERPDPAAPMLPLVVTNAGSGLLRIASLELTGANAADFRLAGDCVPLAGETEVVLGAGARASCQADVTFAPQTPGDLTATLRINRADGFAATSVPLSGTGIPGMLSASPDPATFLGLVCDADGHRRTTVMLTNAGPGDVRVLSVGPAPDPPPAGGWFSVEDPLGGFWIASGTSRTVRLRDCRGRGAGADNSTLQVQSHLGPTPLEIEVRPATANCPGAVCP